MGYAKGEKILRCKLAAVYRLMDLYGWTQGIYNQISVSGWQMEVVLYKTLCCHFLVNYHTKLSA